MKNVFAAVQKWFLAQSLVVKGLVVAGGVAIIAGAGIGIGVSNMSSKDLTAPAEQVVDTQVATAETKEEVEVTVETSEPEVVEAVKEEVGVEETDTEEAAEEEIWEEEVEVVVNKRGGKLKNGNFANGLDYFEYYSFLDNNNDYHADSKNGFNVVINNTGTEDWHVQLKQTGIRLENGQTYRVTLDAKSSLARDISCTLQRNGMKDDDWTPYSNTEILALNKDWQTFTFVFTMDKKTDNDVVFNLAMGKVNGKKITKKHTVGIRNIKLEKLDEDWTNSFYSEDNLIGNPTFEMDGMLWEKSVVAPGTANAYFADKAAVFEISNPGTVDWHVQLKQGGIKLEKDKNYQMTCNVFSTVARTIKFGFMDTDYINWYGGADIVLVPGDNKIDFTFNNSIVDDAKAVLMISMGQIEGVATPAGEIRISECVLKEAKDVAIVAANVVEDTTIRNLDWGWFTYDMNGWHLKDARVAKDNSFEIEVKDNGTEDWHIQLQKKGIQLEKGKWYKISFKAKSTVDRKISVVVQRDGSNDDRWIPYSITADRENIIPLGGGYYEYNQIFQMKEESDDNALYIINLGAVEGDRSDRLHTVSIIGPYFEEVSAPVVPEKVYGADGEMLIGTWEVNGADKGLVAAKVNGNNAEFDIKGVGDNDYDVQLVQKQIKFENGQKYRLSFKASSNVPKTINANIMQDQSWDWFGGTEVVLGTEEQTYEVVFDYNKSTINDGGVFFSMGNFKNATSVPAKVVLKDISLKKVEKAAEENKPAEEGTEETLSAEMLKTEFNGDNWSGFACDGTQAEVDVAFETDKAIVDVKNCGNTDWAIIVRQSNILFERGSKYVVSMKVNSDVDRVIKVGTQNSQDQWFGGTEISLKAGDNEVKEYFTFDESQQPSLGQFVEDGIFQLTFGKMSDATPIKSKLIVSDISLKRVGGDSKLPEKEKEETPETPSLNPEYNSEENAKDNLLNNPNFVNGAEGWGINLTNGGAEATSEIVGNGIKFVTTKLGSADWNIQLSQGGITIEKDAEYEVSFDVASTVTRKIVSQICDPEAGYVGLGGDYDGITEGITHHSYKVVSAEGTTTAALQFNLGNFNNGDSEAGEIIIYNIKLKKIADAPQAEEVNEEDSEDEQGELPLPVALVENEVIEEVADSEEIINEEVDAEEAEEDDENSDEAADVNEDEEAEEATE